MAQDTSRERSMIIRDAMKRGWRIVLHTDGTLEASPPEPTQPVDQFEHVNMNK